MKTKKIMRDIMNDISYLSLDEMKELRLWLEAQIKHKAKIKELQDKLNK